jgi:hypothetical protein
LIWINEAGGQMEVGRPDRAGEYAVWLILFIICFVAAAYGFYGLCIIASVACGRLWRLLLPSPTNEPARSR